MRRSVAARAVGIARIVVPPGGIGADGLFKQGAEVVEQSVLPFIHKDGRGGMKRVNERHPVEYAGFADPLLHKLGQVDELEFLQRRVVEHMSYDRLRQPRMARPDAA